MIRWWLPPRAALRNLRATIGILSDSRAVTRIRFLRTAECAGLIQRLRSPATAEELAQALGIADTGLLENLLDVGVAVGELRSRRGRYSLKGSRIRALASGDGDPLRAVTGELADYHGDVYRDLPALLADRDRQPKRYLDEYDELVARSSRVLEPYIARFVRRVVTDRTTRSLLEIGCGTGVYVRHAAHACPQLRAVGIDMSERVSALATANFAAWGLADRCTALHADIRRLDNLDGPFDAITLHNNVYYFSPAEREHLLAGLRRRLASGGRLVLTSFLAGKGLTAAEFSVVLRATAGCWPLPERGELLDALREAGYSRVAFHRLLRTDPLYGVVAEIP